MDREQLRGLQAAVIAYVTWGLLTIYWKQLSELDPFEIIGWRVMTAMVVMAVAMTAKNGWPAVLGAFRHRPTTVRIVAAALLLTVNWTTYVWAVGNDRIIEAALGYFLAPLGTMALGVFVLGERLNSLKWASVTLSLIAVAVLTMSNGRLPWVAVLIAVSWSSYALAKRQVPLQAAESLTAESLVLVVPALIVIASGFWRSSGVPYEATGAEWGFLLGTGVITAIPLVLFAFAAKRVPFTVLGPANYLVPIINFFLGWLVYDEAMSTSRFVGFSLVWVALAIVTVDTVTARDRAPLPTAVPVR